MSHIIGTEQDDILSGAVEDDFIEGLGGKASASRRRKAS